MKAAHQGLKQIYGFDLPLPEPESGMFLDEAVLWVRNANNRLARLARLDQNYVFRVSIRSRVTEAQFQAGLETLWQFSLSPADFPFQCLTRIRGLSAFSTDKDGGLYQISVRVPREGHIFHPEEQTLDQNEVPRCWLGRVGPRSAIRDADVSGIRALHNCSPIGQWEVELAPAMREVAKQGLLRDIELDVHLAVQQTPAGG